MDSAGINNNNTTLINNMKPKKHTQIQRIKTLEQVVGTMWEVVKKQGTALKALNDKNSTTPENNKPTN